MKLNIKIRLGTKKDIDVLAELYDDLNDYLATTTNYPKWQKGVYPTRREAIDGICEQCLFVATYKNEIVGSVILRHKQEETYLQTKWQGILSEKEVLVIYTFVVNPKYHQLGIGFSICS